MTLFGTADVDCLRLEGEMPEDGDKDRDVSDLGERLAPIGDKLELFDRFTRPLPGAKGSVTARGRDLGRPLSGGVNESWSSSPLI